MVAGAELFDVCGSADDVAAENIVLTFPSSVGRAVTVKVTHPPLAIVPNSQERSGVAMQCVDDESKSSDPNGDRTVTPEAGAFPAFVTATEYVTRPPTATLSG